MGWGKMDAFCVEKNSWNKMADFNVEIAEIPCGVYLTVQLCNYFEKGVWDTGAHVMHLFLKH